MARNRKAANGRTESASELAAESESRPRRESSSHSSPDRAIGPLSVVIMASEREVVKVNNASLTELKNASDDAIKRYLSRPELFKQSYVHTDVKLALGWAGVFVAAGTGLYGYKVEFEQSKPVVWVGLIVYIILTALGALYSYFIEGDIVFVGKRKTFSKRIVTERITLSAKTIPSSSTKPPAYSLSLNYIRSTNGGKSLLAKGKKQDIRGYNSFFDEAGVMDQEAFEAWVGGLVEEAMEGKAT